MKSKHNNLNSKIISGMDGHLMRMNDDVWRGVLLSAVDARNRLLQLHNHLTFSVRVFAIALPNPL